MDFGAFWALYPRRVARRDAEKAWSRMTPDQQSAAMLVLDMHIAYWLALGTSREYVPYPTTWLYGRRWEDELEMPQPKCDEWWKTQAGIAAKAQAVGITPKAGEDWHSLKARIQRVA